VTVTTDQLPTTAPTTSDSTTATTLSTPETQSTDTTADLSDLALRERLPPADANPDATAGAVRDIATASELTAALYSPGDPAATPAAEKLDAAGFAGAVLRDDKGDNPATGLALFRSYVIELGSPEAAVEESDRSVQEVTDTTILDTENFSVAHPRRARRRGLRQPERPGAGGEFIAFPLGPYVLRHPGRCRRLERHRPRPHAGHRTAAVRRRLGRRLSRPAGASPRPMHPGARVVRAPGRLGTSAGGRLVARGLGRRRRLGLGRRALGGPRRIHGRRLPGGELVGSGLGGGSAFLRGARRRGLGSPRPARPEPRSPQPWSRRRRPAWRRWPGAPRPPAPPSYGWCGDAPASSPAPPPPPERARWPRWPAPQRSGSPPPPAPPLRVVRRRTGFFTGTASAPERPRSPRWPRRPRWPASPAGASATGAASSAGASATGAASCGGVPPPPLDLLAGGAATHRLLHGHRLAFGAAPVGLGGLGGLGYGRLSRGCLGDRGGLLHRRLGRRGVPAPGSARSGRERRRRRLERRLDRRRGGRGATTHPARDGAAAVSGSDDALGLRHPERRAPVRARRWPRSARGSRHRAHPPRPSRRLDDLRRGADVRRRRGARRPSRSARRPPRPHRTPVRRPPPPASPPRSSRPRTTHRRAGDAAPVRACPSPHPTARRQRRRSPRSIRHAGVQLGPSMIMSS